MCSANDALLHISKIGGKKNKKNNQNKIKFHPSELQSGKEQDGSRWAPNGLLPEVGLIVYAACLAEKFVYFMQISLQQKLIRLWLVMHSRREAVLSVRADEGMWVWLLQSLRNSSQVCFTQTAGILRLN